MKWIKHITDSADDPDIDDAITLFGSDGYYVFFRTLEVMGREFDVKKSGQNVFSATFFYKKFRLPAKKVDKVLAFYSKRKRIIFEKLDGDELPSVHLNCPKLGELCDEYTRKELKRLQSESGHVSGVGSGVCPVQDKEGEEEGEREEENPPYKSPQGDLLPDEFEEFWQACDRDMKRAPKIKSRERYTLARKGELPAQKKNHLPPASHKQIMDGLARAKRLWDMRGKTDEFIPIPQHATTWLNQLRWTDEYPLPKPKKEPAKGDFWEEG